MNYLFHGRTLSIMNLAQTTLLSITLVCATGCFDHYSPCGGLGEPRCESFGDSGAGGGGDAPGFLDGHIGRDLGGAGQDSGVPDGALPDGALPDGAAPDTGRPPNPLRIERVDLLFVIDNSGSTREEQAALKNELPGLVEGLTAGITPNGERFDPIEDIHVGVITTDMGTGGHTIPTCSEPNFGDDGRFLRAGAGCVLPAGPAFLTFAPGGDPGVLASDLQCLTSVGTSGCGFEQQLDAMLKSLTPVGGTTFVNSTEGHGNGANAGFLREDSLLIIVMLSDEDDCSATDPDLFNRNSERYPGDDLNLRCFSYPEALHPAARYVNGLLALHPPELVIFNLIAGIPADLEAPLGESMDYARLIGPDRDPRMVEQPALADPGLVPSCNTERGRAYPPIRLATVARDLEARGARSHVESICKNGFNTAATVLSLVANRR